MRKTFMRFDDTGSGHISAKDLKEVLGDDWDDAEINEMIQEVDVVQNGKISYDEFLSYFHKDNASYFTPMSPMTPSVDKTEQISKLAKVIDDMMDDTELRSA